MPDTHELPLVSVESVAHWKQVRSSFSSVAQAILERKLAEAGLRNESELCLPHLEQFMNRSIRIAKPNLRVNGRSYSEQSDDEQDTELFDEALDRRVWSLSDQRLQWDLDIASKRRVTPREVENVVRDVIALRKGLDAEDDVDVDSAMDDADEKHDSSSESIIRSESSLLLEQLLGAVPEQLERAQRVKTVDNEIRNLKA